MQTKQTLKLRLLAFVLVLELVWYSFNPVPRTVVRKKQEVGPPDEKKRNLEPRSMSATLPVAFRAATGLPPSADDDGDGFEWPEFIDG